MGLERADDSVYFPETKAVRTQTGEGKGGRRRGAVGKEWRESSVPHLSTPLTHKSFKMFLSPWWG